MNIDEFCLQMENPTQLARLKSKSSQTHCGLRKIARLSQSLYQKQLCTDRKERLYPLTPTLSGSNDQNLITEPDLNWAK